MRFRDLLWILAYPIYQIIGTLRHEASHALAAVAEGARITEFVFWPTRGYWGYVRWEGVVTAWTIGAPYLCDLLTFLVFFAVGYLVYFKRLWIWLNLVVLGMISPFINTLYNYGGGFRGMNDVGNLLDQLPLFYVHSFFGVMIVFYLIGLWLVFTRSRMVKKITEAYG